MNFSGVFNNPALLHVGADEEQGWVVLESLWRFGPFLCRELGLGQVLYTHTSPTKGLFAFAKMQFLHGQSGHFNEGASQVLQFSHSDGSSPGNDQPCQPAGLPDLAVPNQEWRPEAGILLACLQMSTPSSPRRNSGKKQGYPQSPIHSSYSGTSITFPFSHNLQSFPPYLR